MDTLARAWQRGGADLCYLSSRRSAADARADRGVPDGHGFPAGPGLGEAIRCIVVPEFGGLAHLPDDHGEPAAT